VAHEDRHCGLVDDCVGDAAEQGSGGPAALARRQGEEIGSLSGGVTQNSLRRAVGVEHQRLNLAPAPAESWSQTPQVTLRLGLYPGERLTRPCYHPDQCDHGVLPRR